MADYDDELIGRRLVLQIEREIAANQSRSGAFHVTVCRADDLTTVSKLRGALAPGGERVLWARHACRLLNRTAREGGTWVVVWCEPATRAARVPTRLLILWKDRDGDVPCGFDCIRSFEEIVSWGPTWFVDQATRALQGYREHLREVEVKPHHLIKEALGQSSADPTAPPPSDL
jgi:hypothetical protein